MKDVTTLSLVGTQLTYEGTLNPEAIMPLVLRLTFGLGIDLDAVPPKDFTISFEEDSNGDITIVPALTKPDFPIFCKLMTIVAIEQLDRQLERFESIEEPQNFS